MRDQREEGDHFEIPDDGRRTIEGLEDLVAELRALVDVQRANAGADMLRSETQAAIVVALQKLVSRPSGAVDLTPLRELMAEMHGMNESRPRAAYEFAIDRDGNGFMRSITATPIEPTHH